MPLYEYRAIDKVGKSQKGKIDAANEKLAINQVKGKGLHPVSITSAKTKTSRQGKSNSGRQKPVAYHVITGFTRQLSILIGTGIPYDKAFEVLIDEAEDQRFQNILSGVRSQIIEGKSLAQALESHPQHFSAMYVAMVRAGEAGGTLAQVLGYLTTARESTEEITSKAQKALIYPIIMTLIGVGIVIFMITFIIPKIIPLFEQFDMALPLPTRLVIAGSNFIVSNWVLLMAIIVSGVFLGRQYLRSNRGQKFFDRLILTIPILKGVIQKTILFRFSQMLGTLLSSGVELKQSLVIVKDAIGNRTYESHFDKMTHDITSKGMDLSQALRQTGIFPNSVVQMIRVGEESSQLEDMLNKVSEILEKELRRSLEKAIALLEPILILWMASMVGFIILSVMLPMMKMNQLV